MIGRTRLAAVTAAVAVTALAAEPPPLEFHRVHVPAGRLGDVPLGPERRVPLPLAEFEAAVARAAAAAAGDTVRPSAAADVARWQATLDESGALKGTISCQVGRDTAGPGRMLPLGDLAVRRGRLAGTPPREAMIFGTGTGLAVAVPEPGTYELDFACAAAAAGTAVYRLPLVPALATSLAIDLPAGTRPVLSGSAARRALVMPPAAGAVTWRIDVGPAADLVVAVGPRDQPLPSVAVWADVTLAAKRAEFAAVVLPSGAWREGTLVFDKDAELRVTEVRAADDHEPLAHESSGDGRSLTVAVPRRLAGGGVPLLVRGPAPATGTGWRLPLLRPTAGAWAGGGTVVHVAGDSEMRDVELIRECGIVTPEVAASWPRAGGTATDEDAAVGRRAPVVHLEEEGPGATAVVALGPRRATFDVARVTTVDITPGAVLGRAACDVQVAGGEAFEIVARVAPGWIIDSVDAVDGPAAAPAGPPTAGDAVDWRVVPSPAGDTLRVDLAFGATRRGGIGLRVVGHREGLAPGATFTTSDIDMVRFTGEAADAAVLDLLAGPDAFVAIAGRPAGWFPLEGRLAALAEEGKARGRIRAGDRNPDVELRVVRRRPPLDVGVAVRLEPRDAALVQTFTFDCRSAAGLDSLVVDFAEPGGDGLAWRVESPADVDVTARPFGPGDGGLPTRGDAVADSWLVELSPPPTGPVRIRASRSVPFDDTVPVPLAWVEGAEEPGGTVVVAAAPGARPRILNRLLRELPVDPASTAAAVEYAYGEPERSAADMAPVAAGTDARAWAWRETVSCWCDESGSVESESRFEIENEGRDSVSLVLTPGRQLAAVLVDGIAPPGAEIGPAGGTSRLPLPRGRRRVEVVVRTLAAGRSGQATWRIDPEGCGLDVPVLERDVRLLVPPGLAVATAGAEALPQWTTRLFGTGSAAEPDTTLGFRSVPVVMSRVGGVRLIRRRVIAAAAILAALVTGIAAGLLARRRPAAAVVLAVAGAVAALWLPTAFMPVARAAWWAALAGLVANSAAVSRWRPRSAVGAAAAACVAAAVAMPRPATAADDGYRVFVTEAAGGDTALVPEPLFRALAAFAAPESASIRVLACRITASADADATAWRLTIDVDADAGGTLVLDAGPGTRWLPAAAAQPPVAAASVGREARLTATVAGRHTVEIGLVPEVARSGPVATATARIPVAPIAEVRLRSAGAVECERSTAAGAFTRAARTAGGPAGPVFDVSAADRVRLVWPVDPRDRVVAAPRAADTVNDLEWTATGCRVTATIELDAGPDLLRSFDVLVDPRLERLAATATDGVAPRLVPLGRGRVRVELAEAARGRIAVRLSASMPLVDPVGVFDMPGLWVDGLAVETRTVRLAATGFDAALDPPPAAGATAADMATRQPARVIVRRRKPPIRDAQSLAASFAPSGVGLLFEARIDAPDAALVRIPVEVPVGCTVDRVDLRAEDPADPEAPEEPVDVAWIRQAADRVLVVVQRPRPGRFRLKVEGRLAWQPPPRGPLPMMRARLGSESPLVVSWMAEPQFDMTVRQAAGAVVPGPIEVPASGPVPEYEFVARVDADAPRPSAPPGAAEAAEHRVDRAEMRAAFDGRGRVHGLARFDFVAAGPVVRLRLPPGVRLFDVLVDGRVVTAEPKAADAWDVPLGAAPWPRTLLAVFAGDADGAVVDSRPLAVAAPWLEDLPATDVLWSLRPPAGCEVRVAPPARTLDAAAFAAARQAADDRVAAACEQAAAAATGQERERLEALAALRRADRGPVDEQAWRRAGGGRDEAAVDVVAAGAEPIVIRVIRSADETTPARALATVALVAVGSLAWTTAARVRNARRQS